MQDLSRNSAASPSVTAGHKRLTRFRPGTRLRKKVESHVAELAHYQLRDAIHANRVSFPSQVPAFVTRDQRRCDLQWRLVCLYFIRGWSLLDLSNRYGLTRGHLWQILTEWQRRAASAGYVQYIPPLEVLPHATPGYHCVRLVSARPFQPLLNGNSMGAPKMPRPRHLLS